MWFPTNLEQRRPGAYPPQGSQARVIDPKSSGLYGLDQTAVGVEWLCLGQGPAVGHGDHGISHWPILPDKRRLAT